MAIDTTKKAPGNAANTGAPGPTPAPTHVERNFHGDQPYGNNRYGGPSSDTPGKRTTSGFEASKPGPVLDQVMGQGLRSDDASPINGQIRKLSDQNVPNHPAMSRRGPADGSPGATVPNKLGINEAQPVRKPV